ncbi:hypothetical protein [Portibacter marinus]|uniref:hypothetical protein n=1 Tax=Portibacter marinus TaxID=2898660 RepID=UPI001F39DCF1|nr:hypothetical protein [Portibacter marinus]
MIHNNNYENLQYSSLGSKLFTLLLVLSYFNLYGQRSIESLKFNIGTSLTKPDKRVDFVRPNLADNIIDGRPSVLNEFFYGISGDIVVKHNLFFEFGIGTSIIFNNVNRRINYRYFHPQYEIIQLRLWFNDWYFNTSVQPHLGLRKKVFTKGDWDYFMGLNNAFSLSLHKIMFGLSKKGIHYRFSRFTFEPFANETFVTLSMRKGSKAYNLDFRAVNLKFIDNALENNGKNIDFYNPFKVRLRLVYDLATR